MFRRIILFTWTESATEEQRAAVAAELAKLPALIPEIRRLEFGADTTSGNADFGVLADFATKSDWAVYVEHPAHQKVVADHIRPIIAGRTAIQYEF
ncbi:Dabb family protein [Spongiactinospora sp. TRM90649]|uniref:Dabb family protein n=1 Tax=Spongiactinospora sp. TRM90649 TaxID=3031114 RepID=UPI0023F6F879|nr:Dabb family protein [Spongiactinospora sp. TRM90649]MDF5756965.1 Dabb family protein [Spongiactinospora sp. TRM90649]